MMGVLCKEHAEKAAQKTCSLSLHCFIRIQFLLSACSSETELGLAGRARGSDTELSLEFPAHKTWAARSLPWEILWRAGALSFSTSERKGKRWWWRRALVEGWAGADGSGSWLAQQAAVSLPAGLMCTPWPENWGAVQESAGRLKGRKIKEVNSHEQKACWFPVSRVETRGIVILVAQVGSVCCPVLNPVLAGAFSLSCSREAVPLSWGCC